MLGLAVLGAPQGAIIAGVALAFAQLLVAAALIVRLQEAMAAWKPRVRRR